MSAMSSLDAMIKSFPQVKREWLEPLCIRLDRADQVGLVRTEARTLGAALGILDDIRTNLLHHAATMRGPHPGLYEEATVFGMLVIALRDLRDGYDGTWDHEEDPMDVWNGMFARSDDG